MDENFIRTRITKLRLKKGDSEYKMSTFMGKSKGYIQSISSGRALPSMSEFLYMCSAYFGISPKEFFDDETENPILINEAISLMKHMNDDDLKAVIALLARFQPQER